MSFGPTVSSKITCARVYLNGAIISRTVRLNLPAGTHRIYVDDLEHDINEASVKVSIKPSGL